MQDEFDEYVALALKQLPKEFRGQLDNVEIFVEEYPTWQQEEKFNLRQEHRTLLGLYEGIPQTRRGNYGVGPTVPDKITLFRFPILSHAKSRDHLVQLIKDTLFHEIGHHFGMSEEQLQKAQER